MSKKYHIRKDLYKWISEYILLEKTNRPWLTKWIAETKIHHENKLSDYEERWLGKLEAMGICNFESIEEMMIFSFARIENES